MNDAHDVSVKDHISCKMPAPTIKIAVVGPLAVRENNIFLKT